MGNRFFAVIAKPPGRSNPEKRTGSPRTLRVLATTLLLLYASLPVAAQVPGDACATAQQYIVNGGPEALGVVHMMVCEGGTWKSILSANASAEVTKIGNQTCANGDYFKYDGAKFICTTGSGGSGAIDDLTDAFTDYVTTSNMIMGRPGAAALTAGAVANTFIGDLAGATTVNSTGTTDYNTAVGWLALAALTSGRENNAFGESALRMTTTGQENAAFATNALNDNTTGSKNTAFGDEALWTNVGKFESTALGYRAMRYADSTAGGAITYNTAVGAYALRGSATAANNTGNANTALGHSALVAATSGSNNVAIGYNAGNTTTTGSSNILIGSGIVAPAATTSNHLNIGDTIYGDISTGTVGIGVTASGTKLSLLQSNINHNAFVVGTETLGSQTEDVVQVFSTDNDSSFALLNLVAGSTYSGAWSGGTSRFLVRGDGNVGIGTATPTYKLSLDGEAAHTIGMEREQTAATAGRDLTVQSGGARSSGTDLAGGNLVLKSGQSTGTGTSSIVFSVYNTSFSSGTGDAPSMNVARIIDSGLDLSYNSSIEWNTKGNNTNADRYEAGGEEAFQIWQDATGNLLRIQAAPGGTTGNPITFNDAISIASSGSIAIGSSQTTLASKFVVASPTAEVVAAAAVITANACGTVKQISATGNQTTNTTNTFTAPTASYAGCCMDVVNVDTADTITLDANARFKTIGGANQALGPDDSVRVCSNGTNWYQMGAVAGNQ